MNKDLTLVILAAGMGSRFGGLKQIAPMGPNDEFIIDYSVYDAIKAGFNKIVFLIKRENYDVFKETIGSRCEPHIKVEYAFQEGNIPDGEGVPIEREKPLGTGHALICCKDYVNEPFMMINADDFYGRDAFMVGAKFLKEMKDEKPEKYGMVGYMIKNTITENGTVKRGVCLIEDNKLTGIKESSVGREGTKIIARPLSGEKEFDLEDDALVSMNMLLFNPSIFPYLEEKFKIFFQDNQDNLLTCEYLIPDVLAEAIKEGVATCEILATTATWYGVTYKEDTEKVRESIKKLVEDGEYPNNLWD